MTWMTLNQFINNIKPCCKCGALAKWVPHEDSAFVYCDDCFPYKEEKEIEERCRFEGCVPRKWVSKEEAIKLLGLPE